MMNHTERYAAISDTIKKRIGRKLDSFIVLAVDETGEFYWGCDYGSDNSNQRNLLLKLHYVGKEINDILVRND